MKAIGFIGVLCLAFSMLGADMASAQAQVQERVLIYTDHEPLGGMRTRFINEVFFPAIEKESNGRLKIKPHWGGELSISYDALRKVAEGSVADMAIVVPEYTADVLPLHQVFKSFPVGPSGERQLDFFHRVYREIPTLTEELAKANLVAVLFCTGYPTAFFSAGPMNGLEDLREKRYRSASFWHRKFLENGGAEPVVMPWNKEICTALEDGSLDGVMVNVDSGYELGVHEAAPHVLLSKDLWLGHLYLLVMNRSTWDGLAKDDREAIQRAARTAYASLAAMMDSSFDAQVEELRQKGATVRILDFAEVERWQNAIDYHGAQSAWVKEQEKKGVTGAGAVMERVAAIMDDVMRR